MIKFDFRFLIIYSLNFAINEQTYPFYQVLRFSRLFGPGKPSSLPQIWRSVRKRRRKKKHKREFDHSDSGSDNERPRHRPGWDFNYGPQPELNQCRSDDEVRH